MTPETARCFGLMLAAQARVAGMQAENAQREACGGLHINFDSDQLKIETVKFEPLGVKAKWLK